MLGVLGTRGSNLEGIPRVVQKAQGSRGLQHKGAKKHGTSPMSARYAARPRWHKLQFVPREPSQSLCTELHGTERTVQGNFKWEPISKPDPSKGWKVRVRVRLIAFFPV